MTDLEIQNDAEDGRHLQRWWKRENRGEEPGRGEVLITLS